MPRPAWMTPLVITPVFGTIVPIANEDPAPSGARSRIDRHAIGGRARAAFSRAARQVKQRRFVPRPLFGEEVRRPAPLMSYCGPWCVKRIPRSSVSFGVSFQCPEPPAGGLTTTADIYWEIWLDAGTTAGVDQGKAPVMTGFTTQITEHTKRLFLLRDFCDLCQ